VWKWRKFHADGISGTHFTGLHDDAHNARTSNLLAANIALAPQMLLQPHAEVVDPAARSAQTCNFDNRVTAEMQARPQRQRNQIAAASQNVLAYLAGSDIETLGHKLVKHLRSEEMNLAKIRQGRVAAFEIKVLHSASAMSIAFHTFARNEPDRRLRLL